MHTLSNTLTNRTRSILLRLSQAQNSRESATLRELIALTPSLKHVDLQASVRHSASLNASALHLPAPLLRNLESNFMNNSIIDKQSVCKIPLIVSLITRQVFASRGVHSGL